MLQSCLCVVQDGLLFAARELHPSFESLTVIGSLGLHAFLMDFHHDTPFRSILEDDSIPLTSRTCIHFCSSKGARLWLVVRSSICLFCITHSIQRCVFLFV